MAKNRAQEKKRNELIDQLEGYLSETVPYVVKSVKDSATTVFTQHPKLTLSQAANYLRQTVPPKAQKAGQLLQSAYNYATIDNIKNGFYSTDRHLRNGLNYIKDHPYSSGFIGLSILAARYISPIATLAVTAAVVGKTVANHGGMDIGIDNERGKAGVKVRVGPKKP